MNSNLLELKNITETFDIRQSIRHRDGNIQIDDMVHLWSGKGIVIAAGGDRLLANAFVNIKYIREILKSNIPIEIWYLNQSEVNIYFFKELAKYNVAFINAEDIKNTAFPFHNLNGWSLKSYAITHSRFNEVLFLDSDCFLFQNPDKLFHNILYKEYGALFSTDLGISVEDGLRFGRIINPETLLIDTLGVYNKASHSWHHNTPNPLWEATNTQECNIPELESGFMMIDKQIHYKALFFSRLLNEYNNIVYEYIYGDKDTFNIAWCHYNHKCNLITKGIRKEFIETQLNNKILFQHRILDAKFDPSKHINEYPNNIQTHDLDIHQKFLQQAIILSSNTTLNNIYTKPRTCGTSCAPKCYKCLGMHGSAKKLMAPFIDYLKAFIDLHNPSYILDIGSGNGLCLSYLDLDIDIPQDTRYIGIDISSGAIADAEEFYQDRLHQFKFINIDILDYNIPLNIDLIIIKDFFNHLSFNEIKAILTKLLSYNYKYMIICNDLPNLEHDIIRGQYRPLDIMLFIRNHMPDITINITHEFIYQTSLEAKKVITLTK